jgi:hypothetical protein
MTSQFIVSTRVRLLRVVHQLDNLAFGALLDKRVQREEGKFKVATFLKPNHH